MKVLLATASIWSDRIYPPMKERYDVVMVQSFEDALANLSVIHVAVVGFHFDNRRPDRLLRVLQDEGIPSFCVRGVAGDVSDDVLEQTVEAYKKELGCRDFIDFTVQGDEKALAVLYAQLDALAASRAAT
jgi:hypothetical protein